MINEGKTTGGNSVATADRIKKYLNRHQEDYNRYPAYKEASYRRANSIGKKVAKRIADKAPVTKSSKKDLERWNYSDYMGKLVDWQERVGNLLLEYIITEGSFSASKIMRKLKAAQTKQEKSPFGTPSINFGVDSFRKWKKKKSFRKVKEQ